ncbi:MAG TPA: hypothetical protein VIN67_02980, partial [Desulfobaccales bacterium]
LSRDSRGRLSYIKKLKADRFESGCLPMSVVPGLRLPALLSACLLFLAGTALAASPLKEIKDLKQPVAAGSATSYADLLKLVFPEPPAG